MSRPYIRYSAAQLETLVTQSHADRTVLSKVLAELNNRGTPSSKALKDEVRRLLGITKDILTSQAPAVPAGSPRLLEDASGTSSVLTENLPRIDPGYHHTLASGHAAVTPEQGAPEPTAPVHAEVVVGAAPEDRSARSEPSPADLSESDAFGVLKLEGPQSWNAIEEQRRKMVVDILMKRGMKRHLSVQDRTRLKEVNAAARRIFDALRCH